MKSTLFTLTAIASLVGYSNATLAFKDPWSQTKAWKSGEKVEVKWSSEAADADKLCDIQMLNGDKLNSNIVAMVTKPNAPVKCGANQFEIAPLNDFKSGEYWLRIGQASTSTWSYSAVFNFEGKGTVKPMKQADGTTHYPSAEVPKESRNKQQDATKGSIPSSGAALKSGISQSASASSSSPSSPSNASSDKENHASDIKKDNKNAEKSSGETSNHLLSHAVVMGLVSATAYALA